MSKEAQYKECLLMAEYAENTKHCMVSYYVLSPVGDAKTVGGSYQRMFPTMKLYRSYDNADVRRDCNITGAYNPNNRYGSDLSKIPSETVDGYRYYVPAESSGVASRNLYGAVVYRQVPGLGPEGAFQYQCQPMCHELSIDAYG